MTHPKEGRSSTSTPFTAALLLYCCNCCPQANSAGTLTSAGALTPHPRTQSRPHSRASVAAAAACPAAPSAPTCAHGNTYHDTKTNSTPTSIAAAGCFRTPSTTTKSEPATASPVSRVAGSAPSSCTCNSPLP
mmetsp:Transcript_33139/g.73253  ORF Transcript_33139/g.73253 Transcript_33139/m.73253 type:complete len:133 (+) Transcript_33139:352-750(+)